MRDIGIYFGYDIAERVEIMKLTDFAVENNYFLYNRVSLYDNSVTFVFLEQLPIGDWEIVIRINEDLYLRLLSEKKLADYVINEVKKNKKHKVYTGCKKKLGIKSFFNYINDRKEHKNDKS